MKNKKKYTDLKRGGSILSILFPCVLIFGCSVTPPVDIPPPPPKVESVIPQLVKVNSGIDDTIKTNNELASKIKEQKNEFKLQQLDINETLKNAEELLDYLEEYSGIPNADVVITGLHKIKVRNLFLENQNIELEDIRKNQELILKQTKEDADDTYRKLIDKENEASSLRDQNEYLSKNLRVKNDEVENLKTKIASKDVKLARANVYKYWVWGLVGGFLLWTIVKNILMMYNPMMKFRI